MAVVLALATPLLHPWLRRVLVPATEAMPLYFPHRAHSDLSCAGCHHNFVDRTGRGAACIVCHREPRSDLILSVEPRFHGFCESCHLERQLAGKRSGPVRSCAGCHSPNGSAM